MIQVIQEESEMKGSSTISNKYIIDLIQRFIAESPLNTMQDKSGEPAWDSALVGFSSGADPITPLI
jgi:hypothetical protein